MWYLNKSSKSALMLPIAATFTMLPSVAFAQDNKSLAIEEVVVSAQRREQNLQDVPISIQAFSENTLKDSGVDNIQNLGSVTPGLNMTGQLQAVTPYIRGVGSPDASVGQESNVAVYIDGVYQANPNVTAFSFNNIERVEVLKGPQGTLFGRNATGGLLQIISKTPSDTPYIKGSVKAENYQTFGSKLYATNGLFDGVAGDIALVYSDQNDGYGENLTLNTDVNKSTEKGARVSLLFDLSEDSSLLLAGDYAKRSSSVGMYNAVYPGSVAFDGQVIFAGCVAGMGGDPAAPTANQAGTCVPIAQDQATKAPDDWQDSYSAYLGESLSTTRGFTATYTRSLGNVDFKSITAWRESSVSSDFEQSASALELIHIDINKQGYDTTSQEFQFSYLGDRFNWVAGLYLYDDTSGMVGRGLGISGAVVSPSQRIVAEIDTRSYAAFGEVVYSLRDSTRLTLGARFTKDERGITQDFYSGGAFALSSSDEESWSEPTWRVVLDQDFGESTLAYASLSRGFKSGNYNVSAAPGQVPVDPEFIDSFELGVKAQVLDNRLQFNFAAFAYDYTDMQVSRIEAGSLVTVNAAEADVSGLEFDFVGNVSSQLQVMGGLSYVKSEYAKFKNAPVYVPSSTGLGGNELVVTDLSGNDLARSPEVTANVGATYDIGPFVLGANYYYNDGFSWEPSGRIKQDSYQTVNAFAAWYNSDRTIGVRLYGNNLTDEEYASFVLEQEVADNYEPAPPRTFGVELSYEF
ncbi:TonB-dependent receptor [Zhongshania marina]|uniref:TonB-dependent receptor n=2 Tax=Zhongshania marina TaxID=2304603 RepID=A0A2S4HJ77_9GAMM|nr:TonB-dependent receptor [Marortus luteolus]POP53960.1 hypothetical protein C0068_03725 [Marortus luteolus]RNL66684.1 TonB-dependent receptor [Zhongshania marina]